MEVFVTRKRAHVIELLQTLTDFPFTLLYHSGKWQCFEKGKEQNKLQRPAFIDRIQPSLSNGNKPELYISPLLERFIFIDLVPHLDARLIVGPFLTAQLTPETLQLLSNAQPINRRSQLPSYYAQLPCLDVTKQFALIQLIYTIIFGKPLKSETILITDCWLPPTDDTKDRQQLEATATRPNKRSFGMEQHYLALIEQGKTDYLKLLLNQGPLFLDESVGLLATSSLLRHYKNIGIAAVSLATRAAIKGGLFSERAYELSDGYIQQLENCQTIAEADQLIKIALLLFTDEVRRCVNNHLSPHIIKTVHYLKAHLYEEVTVNQLAADLQLSPNYLATCFKRELGVSVLTHLHKLRIEEAQLLIAAHQDSLLEIAQRLKFHDQSHFTRVFKQHTGMTPRTYLNETLC
ncbi:helix-turn-helix domain-containing protein [Brochothrix campestris]|uniref:HTH araC/xylS-type domain-containing protein n=1 Tax=Brochothrix campestris FSL F6-1037 TaxID=1265861 RepID=W7CYS3_9LIST|nr:helix-turn-helix domain-containing protein [Brochothrix campestris]EUJ42107.1 hypothetical protein BCAMP_00715 [Brochothrix campestris FSL F6-1037]